MRTYGFISVQTQDERLITMKVTKPISYISKIKEPMFKLPQQIAQDKRVGIIDADLLDNGTKHPNLALMKISQYYKNNGNNVKLISKYDDCCNYDILILARVFTFTKINNAVFENEIYIGGSGFEMENYKTTDLPYKIEHCMPDYSLYNEYIEDRVRRGDKESRWKDYKELSIGFLTRGCFRKCEFCINKKYNAAFKHSNLDEFLDVSRKRICLWDDNFLAYPKWEEELDRLKATGKYFQFKQGLDIRLLTKKSAEKFANSKYYGDFIFAFDHIKDAQLIDEKLALWRRHCEKGTKLYLFCAYDSQDDKDIEILFERIKILFKYKCLPFVMRYELYKESKFKDIYTTIARWANQPNIVKKMSFRQFCEREQELRKDQSTTCSSYRALTSFERDFPSLASKYFDLKYDD